ncbi:hypothetical protein J610_4041, partial [Acinetobacter sp. 723929]
DSVIDDLLKMKRFILLSVLVFTGVEMQLITKLF